LLLGFGLLSQLNGISEELQLWKGESASRATASLYAPNDFQPEWSGVLSIAQDRRVFMLAYGTGVDLYYPEIGSAQSWMLLPGLLMPREESFVLRQVNAADIVVEEREVTTLYTEHDKELQAALGRFSVKLSGKYFRIWTNDPTARTELLKTAAFHAE
jgi:hypothetical protein